MRVRTFFQLLMFVAAWVVPRAAFGTVYNNRVCIDVNILYLDDDWGTRWTDDSQDKPGRGFKVFVTHGSGLPLALDWPVFGSDAYVETHGTWAGCTDDIAFDTANAPYTITVWSEAKVNNITLSALDDSPTPEQASYAISYTPASDTDVGIVLDGVTARWNVLALDAFALVMVNPITDTLTWELRIRGCPGQPAGTSCASEVNAIINYATPYKKFVVGHELGRA
jgi:hypothetical protein